MKSRYTILLLALAIIMYIPCEAKVLTDHKDSINTGTPAPPQPQSPYEDSATEKDQNCPPNDKNCNGIPDNQENFVIDPDKECPPNDRNCNGIPDDKECIAIDPSDDGTTPEEEEETGEVSLNAFRIDDDI